MKPTKILRLSEVLERYGKKETATRDAIAAGLFPSFVQLGGRCIGLPEHELEQVIRARIAGLPDDEIRKLVERIHADRAITAAELIGGAV
jgi:prophage regulatory protein